MRDEAPDHRADGPVLEREYRKRPRPNRQLDTQYIDWRLGGDRFRYGDARTQVACVFGLCTVLPSKRREGNDPSESAAAMVTIRHARARCD